MYINEKIKKKFHNSNNNLILFKKKYPHNIKVGSKITFPPEIPLHIINNLILSH